MQLCPIQFYCTACGTSLYCEYAKPIKCKCGKKYTKDNVQHYIDVDLRKQKDEDSGYTEEENIYKKKGENHYGIS